MYDTASAGRKNAAVGKAPGAAAGGRIVPDARVVTRARRAWCTPRRWLARTLAGGLRLRSGPR